MSQSDVALPSRRGKRSHVSSRPPANPCRKTTARPTPLALIAVTLLSCGIRITWGELYPNDGVAEAIEERDPHSLPATRGPNKKSLEAAGRWPATARMLNLSQAMSAYPV